MTATAPMRAGHRPIVVTQGDPDGVGLELILRLGAEEAFRAKDVVVADRARLDAVADRLTQAWAAQGRARLEPILHGGDAALGQFDALRIGVDLVLQDPERALVTGPIDKAIAADEGLAYPGHTEYLAARAEAADVAMMMVGPTLKVVLATIHMPLREVADRLSVDAVASAGRLLATSLRDDFEVAAPRIAVLGLNPHAGEKGRLGHEDESIIAPAISALRELAGFASFAGPLPADTGFHAHAVGDYDGLVAMYHDQGLAPFKLIHFHDGVNMTLGLPFVRTSPDHGTARDIAGRGVADPSSFRAAIRLARGIR